MFRLDRFLTLYFFYSLFKRRSSAEELRIPILMYHSISARAENGVHPYYRLNTSPTRFAQHMKYLSDNDYQVISLPEAADLLSKPINHLRNQPLKYVVLTFDDGYQDFMTNARPILRKYGQTATVFLPTAYIGKNRKSFKGRKCLTWSEVCELQNYRVSFGSHTVSHATLYGLSWEKIQGELLNSRLNLEDELQKPMRIFSYPFAFPQEDHGFVQRFKKELIKQGYQTAVTTAIGCARQGNDPLCLKRIPINQGDDQKLFEAKIDGAYDWMADVQYLVRRLKFALSRVKSTQSINFGK
jgi:hypothetical protein